MKKKFMLFIGILILFGLFFVGRFVFLTVQNTNGLLKIVTSPNAKVYLNNVEFGNTPFEQKVKQGEYLLKLTAIDDSTKSAVIESKIQVNKNVLTFVNQDIGSSTLTSSGVIFSLVKMKEKPQKSGVGEIEIHSEPIGAVVYLNNEEHGNTALILSNIAEGQQEITVSSPGFFPRSEKVEVKKGYRIIAQFKLAIDPSHKPIKESDLNKVATDEGKIETTPTPTGLTTTSVIIQIKDTGTGFLRVRNDASLSASESARVLPGKKFAVLEEQTGWIKIEYEKGKTGWVSSQYTEKIAN